MKFYTPAVMSDNTYQRLIESGYQAEKELQCRKTIVVQEQGKKYSLDISEQMPSAAFQVDGSIVKSGRKCDKLIMVRTAEEPDESWVQIFVELKGRDVIHGMEQLLETVSSSVFKHPTNKVRRARLVASGVPANRSNPQVEKLKQAFTKLNVHYRSIKSGQHDKL